MFLRKLPALALAAAVSTACGTDRQPPPDDTDDPTIDQALLATYKRALPQRSVLEARAPIRETATGANMVIGQVAEYPSHALPVIHGINAHIGGLIDALEFVTSLTPSYYDETTLEFGWGPYDDDNSEYADDKVFVYVKDQGEGADFRYVYALLRGVGDQAIESYVPVIVGGANPDAEEEDHGNGSTLWDFDANQSFLDANYPDNTEARTGKFAALFSKDRGEDGNVLTVVLAAIRNHTGANGEGPRDLDHLWGHVENDDAPEVAFVHITTQGNTDASTTELEDFDLRVAHIEDVGGRGEAIVSGGDLGDVIGDGTECFGPAGRRTYFEFGMTDGTGTRTSLGAEGANEDCGVFVPTLDELTVPSLDSVDPALVAAVQDAATNGF